MNSSTRCFLVLFLFCGLLVASDAFGQGCVAVRHMSTTAPGANSAELFKLRQKGTWQLSLGYRYFRSYKHFVGDVEQKHRVEQGTEVINVAHAADLGLTYIANPRLSLSVNLPVLVNDRSSLYEHYGNAIKDNPTQARFHTHSKGIGDLRISGSYWLVNPAKLPKGNVALGLGVKLPTGNFKAKDNFHKRTKAGKDSIVNKYVDQSMQLGDGGWGFTVDVQGYRQFGRSTSLYFNGFYLFSPKELNSETNLSVPDQFAARLGLSQSVRFAKGLSVLLGGRVEGLPAIDLIGSSQGSRRPGYIVSVEPGLAYVKGKTAFSATLPVALYRNRTKSYADRQDPAGLKHGDAAFADWLLSANVTHFF